MQLATLFFLSAIDVLDFRHLCLLSNPEIDYNNLSITGVFPQEDIEVAVNKFEALIKKTSNN
jgi:hypothetical protein